MTGMDTSSLFGNVNYLALLVVHVVHSSWFAVLAVSNCADWAACGFRSFVG